MQNDIIDMIEPTPKLTTPMCRLVSFLIFFALKFTTYIAGIVAWYLYDLFIAFLTLVLSFIVMGILRSKLRNSAIPLNQQEYPYTDKAIADWYTSKELCGAYDD